MSADTLHVVTFNIHKGFSAFARRLTVHDLRDKERRLTNVRAPERVVRMRDEDEAALRVDRIGRLIGGEAGRDGTPVRPLVEISRAVEHYGFLGGAICSSRLRFRARAAERTEL